MHKLFLLCYSLSQLKLSQLFYLIYYRSLGFKRVSSPHIPDGFAASLDCRLIPHRETIVDAERRTICLLHKTITYIPDQFDWAPKACNRLWRYHLHYFDFLAQENLPQEKKAEFINDWIHQNPQGTEPAWEPYTASLRIVNWVDHFAGIQPLTSWSRSLYWQARWLRANLERHILANHYFENIKALLFAAVYFRQIGGVLQAEISEWRKFALAQLESQLQEQFLTDGGHYERSPQYHNIMMKNCIELLALLRFNGYGQHMVCDVLQRVIHKGMALAVSIERPDGCIPLFNDSALHQGPDTASLLRAAATLNIRVLQPKGGLTLVSAADTGIYGVKVNKDWLMIDCGDIGPSYQPGHTHCDFLSYELMLSKLPLIVDSGVFEYEVTPLRHQLRSTAAHNTVSVDGLEQSEIWSSFRVARRAEKLRGTIQRNRNTITFEGAYKGFFSGMSWTSHTRKMEIILGEDDNAISLIRVRDELKSKKNKPLHCTGFVHLHPAVGVEQLSDCEYLLKHSSRPIARLYIEIATDVKLVPSVYSPEFGLRFESVKFAIKGHDNRIAYEIHRVMSD